MDNTHQHHRDSNADEDDDAAGNINTEPESSNIGFDFVQLGRSLELSTSSTVQQQENDDDDNNKNSASATTSNDSSAAAEFVSIISDQEEEKTTKPDDPDFDYSWTNEDNDLTTQGSNSGDAAGCEHDDSAAGSSSSSLESIMRRFEASTETVLESLSPTIASLAAVVPRGFLEKSDNKKGRLIVSWIMAGMLVVLAMMLTKPTTTTSSTTTIPPTSPQQDLQSFVASLERDRKNDNNNMDKLEGLRTQEFQRYARSACVAAGSLEKARRALSIQMTGIPDNVRNLVIERALIEGVTHQSSMQDTWSSSPHQLELESHGGGRVQSYMAFWSTVYHHHQAPRGRRDDIKYETCVLVAGMEIGVIESIAGYTTKEKSVVVGSTPCECGYLYCAGTCPIFDKVIEHVPMFQCQSLSLKEQDDLHRWLVKNAIDAAEALVGGESNNAHKLPNDVGRDGKEDDKNTSSWTQAEIISWKKPPVQEAFYSGDP